VHITGKPATAGLSLLVNAAPIGQKFFGFFLFHISSSSSVADGSDIKPQQQGCYCAVANRENGLLLLLLSLSHTDRFPRAG
jgi:hypothetical protein